MKMKRPKNRFVSLLLSSVLIGAGVGVPIQIYQLQSANAAIPTINGASGSTSGCSSIVIVGSSDITGWKYSYDGEAYAVIPGQTSGTLSYSISGGWYSEYFRPWVKAFNLDGESLPVQITNSSGTCRTPYKTFDSTVIATTAPSGTAGVNFVLTSQVSVSAPFATSNTYSWERCTSASDLGTCSTISGATSETYTTTSSDLDKYLRSVVVQ
jgi:hypothetical protein